MIRILTAITWAIVETIDAARSLASPRQPAKRARLEPAEPDPSLVAASDPRVNVVVKLGRYS